ncbi:hypothetical protein AB4Y43_07895 [Paraburkholderia sp. BR10872]|uniref:DUF6933 domain-containing protein n=1 Tax=Paraburkholderia sp. BR10872 TaxID=3236989 RepID=UPI0034D2389B
MGISPSDVRHAGTTGVRPHFFTGLLFFFMLYFYCTQKPLKRLKPELVEAGCSTTKPGSWYATVLSWKQQIAMLVNEGTLLPVLMPLAPAATLTARFPADLAQILAAHGVLFIHCV